MNKIKKNLKKNEYILKRAKTKIKLFIIYTYLIN